MTDLEFFEYQYEVDDTAVSYENLPDGRTLITGDDGEQWLVWEEGDALREQTIKKGWRSLD